MASKFTDKGLQVLGDRSFGTSAAAIQTMSIDDSSVAIGDTDDALNDGGAVTNEADAATTPSRSGQTVSHVAAFAAGTGTMTVRRICLHNDTTTNVTTSSTTLCAGVDGQSIVKPATLGLTFTLKYTLARA